MMRILCLSIAVIAVGLGCHCVQGGRAVAGRTDLGSESCSANVVSYTLGVLKRDGAVLLVGDVTIPGVYCVREAPTLASAIQLAGGFKETSLMEDIHVWRGTNTMHIDYRSIRSKAVPDLQLRAMDVLWVPENRFAKGLIERMKTTR